MCRLIFLRCAIVATVLVRAACSIGAEVGPLPGSRVLAKTEFAIIRVMPNEQSAKVDWRPACEALQILDVQGHWLLVDRGWIKAVDAISSKEAVEYFTRELSRGPSLFAYCGRCRAYCTNREIKKAFADAEDAVKLAPASATALYCRGVAHYIAENADRAVNDFSAAIAADRSYSEAYVARARALAEKALVPRAIADLDDAARLTPRWATVYVDRGATYADSGSRENALRDFNRALRLQPRLAEAYFGRGMLLSDDGDGSGAMQDFTEAIRLNPRLAGAFLGRGRVLLRHGEPRKALADLDEAVRLDLDFAEALVLRAIAWSKLGDDKAACDELTKAIRIDPRREQLYLIRAKLLRRLLEHERAAADYSSAIRLNGRDPDVYSLRAAQYLLLGDYEKAVEDYDKSIELDPRRARPYHDRALLLAGCPNDTVHSPRRAIESATKACELTAWQDDLMLAALAVAFASSGDFDAAIKWQTRMLELLPAGHPRRAAEQRRLELYRRGIPLRGFGAAPQTGGRR